MTPQNTGAFPSSRSVASDSHVWEPCTASGHATRQPSCRRKGFRRTDRISTPAFHIARTIALCNAPGAGGLALFTAFTFVTHGFAIAIEMRGGSSMDMRITGHNVSISTALKTYTERRLRSVFGNTPPAFNEVEVRLSDVNGPRGGVDKECAIRVALHRTGVVFVRANGEDAYATVDKAASRLKLAVARRMGRGRSIRRNLFAPAHSS